jgi:hypothetical protein
MSIEPPNKQPIPKWASTLINAANSRNHARGSTEKFAVGDLVEIWVECGGRCAVSCVFRWNVITDSGGR